MLLAIGLTQVHVAAALVVVVWFFALTRRGKLDTDACSSWRFNLLQIGLVLLTLLTLGILVVVVREGLLGNPEMFIIGNNSSRTYLQWFQPRVGPQLPEPLHRVDLGLVLPAADAGLGPLARQCPAALAEVGLAAVQPRRRLEALVCRRASARTPEVPPA